MPQTASGGKREVAKIPYATFARRLNALTLDFVIGVSLAGGLIALALQVQASVAARLIVFASLVAVALLYEPVCVWRFGRTPGHRAFNLEVADGGSGARLGLVRALVRFLLKGFLGWLSFFTMAFTKRRQAMHDILTGSVVRVRDMARAQPWHYVLGPGPRP